MRLLGENGAGKSTLVKCVVGYHKPDDGAVLLDGREHDIVSPTVARELGIGMVYQHFTVVPGLTVAENLLLARGRLPLVLDWRAARVELEAFLRTTPFRLPLDATPLDLSAGEKQKLEILKQLFLQPRLLILDEPTSVLTPQEADEVLGALRERAHSGACSIVLITHKFREVNAYADDVSVLRRGRMVMSARVAETGAEALADAMVGERAAARDPVAWQRQPNGIGAPVLQIERLSVRGDRGELALRELSLTVRAGEIVGVAGVSGNGQRELMQSLTGQRVREGGAVRVDGQPYRATRSQNHHHAVRSLPEEPLANACVGELGVGSNMALRGFDRAPLSRSGWMRWGRVADARARTDHRIRRQDTRRERSDPHAVGRQRATRGAGTRAVEPGALAAGGQPGVRPGLRRRRRDPCAPDGGAQWRCRRAADQRRPRRTAGVVGPHRRHQRRPHRARDLGCRRRPPHARRPHGRPRARGARCRCRRPT